MIHEFKPLISVVIPLFNKAKYIQRSLDSVLHQSFQNFEIIVIDDGSTDGGPMFVASYADIRIRLISQKNSGVSVARNLGIHEAKGEYIAFLDADDEWSPEFLSTVRLLQEQYPVAKVFATGYCSKYESSEKYINYTFDPIPDAPWNGIIDNYFACLYRNTSGPLWTGAICIERSILLQYGGFDSSLKIGEDLDLWIRLFLNSKVAFSADIKSIYYLDVVNSSRDLHDVIPEEYKFVLKMKKRLKQNEIPQIYFQDYKNFICKKLVIEIKLLIQNHRRIDALKIVGENFFFFSTTRKIKVLFRLLTPNSLIAILERKNLVIQKS